LHGGLKIEIDSGVFLPLPPKAVLSSSRSCLLLRKREARRDDEGSEVGWRYWVESLVKVVVVQSVYHVEILLID
jgi:hypothetical protein